MIASSVIGLTLILAGCGPASERPVRGAVPGTEHPAATPPGVPPTLAASEALRFNPLPSPSPAAAAGASPSPAASPAAGASPAASPSVVAAPPIVRTIAPAASGQVPAGAPVGVSAVLVGRGADLESASLAVNGADTGAQIDKRSPRDWTIHASQSLPPGTHTARVLVRDASGAAGGFTWQFVVGDEAAPEPTEPPKPQATPAPAKPEPAPAKPEPTAAPKPQAPAAPKPQATAAPARPAATPTARP